MPELIWRVLRKKRWGRVCLQIVKTFPNGSDVIQNMHHAMRTRVPKYKIIWHCMGYSRWSVSNGKHSDIKVKRQRCRFIVWYQIFHPTFTFLPPGHWTCLFVCHLNSTEIYSPAAISAHWTYHAHCHLCHTRYSFSPESSAAFEG